MSKKTGKLKRLFMAVGLSILSICTLNQVADAALSGEVKFRKKTDVPTGKVRYQLELKANENETLEGLYVGGIKLGDYSASENSIYKGTVEGPSATVVVEVSSIVDTIQLKDDRGVSYDISVKGNIGDLDNYGPSIKWICRGTHKGEEEEVIELRAEDSTYIDKVTALEVTEEPDQESGEMVIISARERAALATAEPNEWSEETVLKYNTSSIPGGAEYIRVYDILGNYTDLKAPGVSEACTQGPKIKWAYKSEDRIWTSEALKEDLNNTNGMQYTPEELNYVQFEAVDDKAVITKIVDQDGKDRVRIDEKDQKDIVTTMYKFKDKERYFFVENLFGYKTLVAIQPEYKVNEEGSKTLVEIQTELNNIADNGYTYNQTESANDILVDVSYVVAAKNEDGSRVALSMEIPKNTELITLKTEEGVDIAVATESPVPTAKNAGEARRGSDRLVATYEDVPVGTTHVDVTYGNKALVPGSEGTHPIVPMGENEKPANLAANEAIIINGSVDLDSLKYDEKVAESLVLGEDESYADVPLNRRVDVPMDSEEAVNTLLAEVEDLTYITHDGVKVNNESVADPRVIIPLGEDDFASLPDKQKVIVPFSGNFATLSDNEKVKVPMEKIANSSNTEVYKRVHRDNEHMYKIDVKYDTTVKYSAERKYDTTKRFAIDKKYDINNKYDVTHVYDTGKNPHHNEVGMIQVGLDLDLVEPKVVLRKSDDGSISDNAVGAKARVYRNKESNATMALIEVTDVVSGIAKVGAYPEVGENDAETNLATAQKNYEDAVKAKATADAAYDAAVEAKTVAERQLAAKIAAKNAKSTLKEQKEEVLGTIDLPEDTTTALYVQKLAEQTALEEEISALEGEISALEGEISALSAGLFDADETEDTNDTDGAYVAAVKTAEAGKVTQQNSLNAARSALAVVEANYKAGKKLFDIKGLPKSVVQLIKLDTNSKYIRVYDGIGNCNEINIYDVIDNTDPENPKDKKGITKIDGYRENNGADEENMGLELLLKIDDDKSLDGNKTQHVVEVDYCSSTVGMRSFVRAANINEARNVVVTKAREKAYGEKEFVKNEAYNVQGSEEYLYETLQTSEDIAKCYPVEPQVSEIKGAQLQGEPYCWAIDAFGNAAMYDLNKVLFKGGVGNDNDDTDHYVMMDKNGDITTAISVKVEDLRRVKKIAAIIDDEEITLETFETGDTPSAGGTGPEDVDRVYEIGEGIVGDVIIYHTNDKTVLTSHQNVVKPVYVVKGTKDGEEIADEENTRAKYVQLIDNGEDSYKAIVKYGIKRIDYSDDTVIEFYDEIPKDVDVHGRGDQPQRIKITDALGYEYMLGGTNSDVTNYPKHQDPEDTSGGDDNTPGNGTPGNDTPNP